MILDCLMYDDDDLFAAGLYLLERMFTQRRQVVAAFGQVTLLLDEKVAPFFLLLTES